MGECEESSCLLPDTQPATQPLEFEDYESTDSYSQEPPNYWARLYGARDSLCCQDLIEDKISIGRMSSCDITVREEHLPSHMWSVISKLHFTIYRNSKSSVTTNVFIEDFSMNGTYVNGEPLEKGKPKPLRHNDVIAVAKPQFKVYYYVENHVEPSVSRCLQSKYQVSVRLGSGAFGEVSLIFNKDSGQRFAMKTLIKENITNEKKLVSEILKLENEIKILKSLEHPNIIKLVDVVDSTKQKFLILEFMEGKDLYDRITKNTKLTEELAKLYMYQIVSGVDYLHQNGIVHRDLKPENVLLASEDEFTVVKITDFGLSKIVHSETYMNSLCGTRMYVAPEVLISGGAEVYTGQVDIWSMGVISFVCLSGQTPFGEGRFNMTIDSQIKNAKYNMQALVWRSVSRSAKQLVKRMMTLDPEKRIKINEILEDPWFADHNMRAKLNELTSKTKSMEQNKENMSSPVPANLGLHLTSSPPAKKMKMEVDVDVDEDSATLMCME